MFKGIYSQNISYLTIIELYHILQNKSSLFLKNKNNKKEYRKNAFQNFIFLKIFVLFGCVLFLIFSE